MADTPVVTTTQLPQLNQQFLDFLKQFPAELAKLVAIIKEFYKQQNNPVSPATGTVPEGPGYVFPDQPPVMTTIPITNEELDKMMENRADQAVIEKAVIFIKGFIMGAMLVGGA